MVRIEDQTRDFYIKSLKLQEDITNEQLHKKLKIEHNLLEKRYEIMNYMIEKKDFDI
jgi:hypothetical protein